MTTISRIRHRMGCNDEASAAPNQLTLFDAGWVYANMFVGSWLGTARPVANSDMLSNPHQLDGIVTLVAGGKAVPASFWSDVEMHWKGGSYDLERNGTKWYVRTFAGYVKLPASPRGAKFGAPPKHYVFGSYILSGADPTASSQASGAAFNEILREPVRRSLAAIGP